LPAADFKVRSIDLYITTTCNRRCGHCFLSDAYFASDMRMSLATVGQIASWAAGGNVDEITLLGGEPATHPDFRDIALLVQAEGFAVRTVTNGSRQFREALLNPSVAAAMERVAVSLDSPSPALCDRLRGRGAFRDAMATIGQLTDQGIAIDINFTVVRSSLDRITEMVSFAEELGARRINIHWFSLVGRAREHAAHEEISAEQWRAVVTEVNAYRPRSSEFRVDCELGFAFGMPGEDQGMCAVRDRSNLQFLPDGTVYSCGMLVEDPSQAGYLWRDGTLLLRNGDTEVGRTSAPCAGCPVRTARSEAPGTAPVPLCIYNRLARA
jgi:MoaA/NifB/PqqE/SkfB family radical SAM enzyme